MLNNVILYIFKAQKVLCFKNIKYICAVINNKPVLQTKTKTAICKYKKINKI